MVRPETTRNHNGMTGVNPNLGHGLYLSAALHGGLVLALVFLAAPRPFAEAAPDAVEVEVLTEKEVAEETKKEVVEESRKEQPPPLVRPAEPKPELRPSQHAQTAASAAAASAPAPTPAPGAALPAAAPPPPPRPEPAPPQGTFSAFNPAGMAEYYNLRPPVVDFDAIAAETAKLSSQEVAAFRANLRRCWRQPEGASPSSRARVLLRVSFSPDGALAAEPALIEASASRDGPAVYKAALQALAQCQPYRTLPRERYREWKVLDVTFSAQEMGGG
jgi:hypothetical protein